MSKVLADLKPPSNISIIRHHEYQTSPNDVESWLAGSSGLKSKIDDICQVSFSAEGKKSSWYASGFTRLDIIGTTSLGVETRGVKEMIS